MKRILLLYILLSSLCFNALAINSPHRFVQDSIKLNKLFNNVQRYMDANNLYSATIALQKLNRLAFASSDSLGLRTQERYLKLKFDINFRQKTYNEALKIADQLMKLSIEMGDKAFTSDVYYAIAVVRREMGQLNVAAESIVKAMKIVDSEKNDKLKVKYYQFLSDIFIELRDAKKSLYYSTKMYELAKKSGSFNLIKTKLNLVLSEVLSGKFDLAHQHLKEVERDVDKKKQPFEIANVYLSLGHLYFEKGEYLNALAHLNKVSPYVALINNKNNLRLHTEIAMAESYTALKQYKAAQYYFNRNINDALREMDSGDIKICLKLGSTIYEGLGEQTKALAYLKKYTVYSDSLNKAAIDKTIHETEIKYQTTLKEKAISEQKLLLVNKDYEIQKKNRYLIIGFSALFLLILLTSIAYLVYRNRNQSIELSLLKAQIHPHFLFNTLNNLYALSISKSDEAPGVVMSLANILRYILYECNTLNADLQKEMDIISEYINLEKIRYADGLEVNTHFNSDFTGYTVAPLLLLPLVENAYKHGVSKLEKDSWINIEAKMKDDRFVFKISNNKPIAKMELEQKTIYGNIGLKNIKKRLDIIYPKQHKFKISQSEDMFVVTLELIAKKKV